VSSDKVSYHERTTILDGKYLMAIINTLTEFADYVDRYAK
jgi:hypothetical protein